MIPNDPLLNYQLFKSDKKTYIGFLEKNKIKIIQYYDTPRNYKTEMGHTDLGIFWFTKCKPMMLKNSTRCGTRKFWACEPIYT